MEIINIIGGIIFGGFFVYNGVMHFIKLDSMTAYADSKRVPKPKFAVLFGGIMLIIGGLSVMTGFASAIGVWILVIFMLATTAMMHRFWDATDPMVRMSETVQFAKNIAIIGALLMIATK